MVPHSLSGLNPLSELQFVTNLVIDSKPLSTENDKTKPHKHNCEALLKKGNSENLFHCTIPVFGNFPVLDAEHIKPGSRVFFCIVLWIS